MLLLSVDVAPCEIRLKSFICMQVSGVGERAEKGANRIDNRDTHTHTCVPSASAGMRVDAAALSEEAVCLEAEQQQVRVHSDSGSHLGAKVIKSPGN